MKEKLKKLLEIADGIDIDDAQDVSVFKTCSGYTSIIIYQQDGTQYRATKWHTGEVEFFKNENKAEKL